MINWLCKIFIKNYDDIHDSKVRGRYGKFAGIVGIISNLILFSLKLILGLLTGAISIVADAINNLADMGSSVITLIGFKLSTMPADEEHPFGHERIEYITGLIVSILIIIIGLSLGKSSFDKIISPLPLDNTYIVITCILLGVAILIKLWQSIFNYKIGKKIDSVALLATSQDSKNDVISTLAVLLGIILSTYVFNFNLDGYLGIAVSLFIIISGIKLVKETTDPLIGVTPDKERVKEITDKILSYEGVLGIHDLVCHMYGQTKLFMTVHVEVDANASLLESHDKIDTIEKEVGQEFNVELTIHMDPIETNNEDLTKISQIIKEHLKGYEDDLTFHDLRMVRGYTHTNIIFDIVIPYSSKISQKELFKNLETVIKNEDELYEIVVNFDHNYIS